MKRTVTILVLALAVTISACRPDGARPSRAARTPAPVSPPASSAPANPFGLMLGLYSPQRLALVRRLGVAYFRPSDAIVADRWDGRCAQCDLARQAGLQLVLSVRASGGGGTSPSAPPQDLAAYRETLGKILDQTSPRVLSVENEENSALFYSGTPQEYGVELQAACQVAHAKGIACTNGGLVSGAVALLLWDHILSTQPDQACSFARRAFDPPQAQLLCDVKSVDQLPGWVRDQVSKGQALLQVYRTAGIDYLNFHWYIADPAVLEEAAAFLQASTGLPLMSNEMGQQDTSPATVQALLQKSLDLRLPIVIWYSIDSPQAKALNEQDNTLRPAGQAFEAFMRTHGYK